MLKNILATFGAQTFRPLTTLYRKRASYLVNKCLGTSDLPTSLGVIKSAVLTSRNYAEIRGGKGGKQMEINRKELAEAFDLEELEEDFIEPVERFKAQLRRQIAPKPESYYVKNFEFTFEGKIYKIEELAQVGKNSQGHYVLHFDGAPKAIPALIHAIQTSKSDWNVQPEGIKIHVQMPKMLRDSRPYLKKVCKSHLNACKDELMIIKYKYLRILGKQDALSLDLKFKLQDQLNIMADQLVKEAERHLRQKLVELQQEVD